jgi:hypothetical protein
MGLDADSVLVIGLVLLVLSIPSIVAAYADRYIPRLSVLLCLSGLLAVGWAYWASPTAYGLADIPTVLVQVIARFL